jgi:predicted O-linked N-acetylglucosamine transferase (SPINDLY family)
MSTDAWRRTILADAPHALVYPEIGMDPMAVRLAAQRLAPVQCNFWGHPETSGFPTLDYFLSSDLMEPPDGDNHYTEKLVRLPNLSIYYEPPQVRPIAMKREQLGFRATATAYWCAQSLFKYLPHFDEIYPRIAREVGDCQFAFIQHQGAREVTDLFLKRLDAAFSAYGLSARDHCVMLSRLDMQQFISAVGCCDVILDSIGWSGGNTTLESLCHNLPIVTLPGSLMRGRHTAGILTMMGVTETIVPTVDLYVATAVKLARNGAWRADIRGRMGAQTERVYRDTVAIRALEDFLESAIKSSCG